MKKQQLLLLGILAACVLLRFYRFSSPIADWHSWRQTDTSSVSRIFVQKGFDVLHPKFQDLSNVPSGFDNPQGYRFVEFPIYNVLQGGLFVLFGTLTIEEWGRIVTIVASLFSTLLLYGLVKRHAETNVGLFAAFFYAVLPYSIFYGRVILPDPLMVTTTLAGIYFFDLWVNEKKESVSLLSVWALLSLFFFASALLLKPFAAFFFLPVFALAYIKFGFRFWAKWQLYIVAILSCVPLALWRIWMTKFPEGVPASSWLFNGGDIRFKGAFFYWIFDDHIGVEILGLLGFALIVLGVVAVLSFLYLKEKKDRLFFFSFFLASILYLFVIARGNVQHDYYQIPIIPTVSLFLAFGASFFFTPLQALHKTGSRAVLIVVTAFMLFFAWYKVRDLFNINNPNIVIAGQIVDKLTPKDAKILTFYDGDTTFLYQTNRQGWASLEKPLPEMIAMGASYLAIVNPTRNDFSGLGKQYSVVASDPRYLILKLTK